jgi:prolyl oligopeptidase
MRYLLFATVLFACGKGSSPNPPKTPMSPPNPTPISNSETPSTPPATKPADDPHFWLEDVTGDKALTWVKQQNAVSQGELEKTPGFGELKSRLLSIYDSKAKIPGASVRGKWLYNFWTDEANPRGLWRRTTLSEYRKKSPKWETIIDVDALGKAEKENWVWHGAQCFYPKYERCLVSLSRGGADADTTREFDITTKSFVAGGFALPEAKGSASWKDLDTVMVATDFGPGSMTDSGYPRIVKEWRRGTPLSEARTIFEGKSSDVSVNGYREFGYGRVRDWVTRSPSFFTEETFLRDGDKLIRIETPSDASVGSWDEHLLITLRSGWTIADKTWPAGALLAIKLDEFLAGKRGFAMLFEPTPKTSLEGMAATKSGMLITELDDVKSRVYLHKLIKGAWSRTKVQTPEVGSINVQAYDAEFSDDYWYFESGFTTPVTMYLGNINKTKRSLLKSNPTFFAADDVVSTQHFATSKDGTKIPYFEIAKRSAYTKGPAPTILYGYGGFEVSLTPGYDPTSGAAWIERGGVYVSANIRGGGEYGPTWHQAALKHKRQAAYDDFIAIAEDLIARKVTTTPQLGIMGGSNGGLLMGVMMTQRPDLFGAIVCQVPLLDMRRYHKLLAGASWMEEYGNPDNEADWAALSKFSPYQNIKSGVTYPRTLFTTSTRDDRVHPGHARKMVARLKEFNQNILYYENIEGGHGGAADNKQAAYNEAMAYSFFAKQLGM